MSSPNLFGTGIAVSLLSDIKLMSCIAIIIKRVDLIGQAAFPGALMNLLDVAWIYVHILGLLWLTVQGILVYICL